MEHLEEFIEEYHSAVSISQVLLTEELKQSKIHRNPEEWAGPCLLLLQIKLENLRKSKAGQETTYGFGPNAINLDR